jgi:sodium/bile acid cotransporter 7
MQQWFLPVGLVLAILLALAAPGPGTALNGTGLVIGLVPLIFLVNGYQTRLDMLSLGGRFLAVLASGAGIGLLLSPFLGLAAAALLGLPAAAALGLVVMASMPPTLSSGVILVENAGGHTLWAMLLTILLNLAGIFTIPFMLDLTLEAGAERGRCCGVCSVSCCCRSRSVGCCAGCSRARRRAGSATCRRRASSWRSGCRCRPHAERCSN